MRACQKLPELGQTPPAQARRETRIMCRPDQAPSAFILATSTLRNICSESPMYVAHTRLRVEDDGWYNSAGHTDARSHAGRTPICRSETLGPVNLCVLSTVS